MAHYMYMGGGTVVPILAAFGIIISASALIFGTPAYAATKSFSYPPLPIPIFGPVDHTYNLTIGNQSYPIRYGVPLGKGTVESINANFTSKSITVIINDVNDNSTTTGSFVGLYGKGRLFSIELSRKIVDSNTTKEAGGCSQFNAGNGTVFWSRNHDMPYKIAVTTLPEGKIATYDNTWDGEECTFDNRILSIGYPAGIKSMIVIQGTAMVPEFGSSLISLAIMTAVIGGVIMMVRVGRSRILKG